MPDFQSLIPDPLAVSRDARCTAVRRAEDRGECGRTSRFVVERSDGDESFGSGGGTEESCGKHLPATVLAMVSGDTGVRAVVTIRWDEPGRSGDVA
jgi:hypothetical protein